MWSCWPPACSRCQAKAACPPRPGRQPGGGRETVAGKRSMRGRAGAALREEGDKYSAVPESTFGLGKSLGIAVAGHEANGAARQG